MLLYYDFRYTVVLQLQSVIAYSGKRSIGASATAIKTRRARVHFQGQMSRSQLKIRMVMIRWLYNNIKLYDARLLRHTFR
jgi:hypothetical protein